MYYQAKVDINNNTCKKFEALLRYKIDGQIKGPIFLDAIEQAGLAHIIDLWVCKKVKEDLKNWQKDDFHPLISINLNPDTIKSTQIINEIISMFKGHNIEFEIIERSFLFKNAQDNINLLIKNGFEISIDDFGTGYSSLETIAKHNIHELKLDKSLIDIIHTKKGYSICKHTTNLCHDIGAVIVAEGVETKEQLDIVKSLNIDLVQGYYFSKAISFNSVLKFKKDFEK
jgi:EAL domain-containing protein (putative c-di-GMP-specific phosphodiesterase class I)